MNTTPVREGFHAITPYLFARDAARLVEFITAAFGGRVDGRKDRPDGTIMHAELQIGDSKLMLAEASARFGPMPTSIYLYVSDCDTVYQAALRSGGMSVFPIMTLPSGERYGGIKDPCGNIWWVATHVEDVPPEEQDRRWKLFQMPASQNVD